jgi:hypothetical protein
MAFSWMHNSNVADTSRSNGRLLELGGMAYIQALGKRSFTRMINTIQIIYNRLYQANPRSHTYDDWDTAQVMRLLNEKSKIDPKEDIYRELILKISQLKTKTITQSFIERFCLAKLSEAILEEYPVNVAEAYVLAYIMLNKPTDMNGMYFKLGTSGLLGSTLINGEMISDIEAVAKFIITSLQEAELLIIVEDRWLKPGKNLILMN